MKMFVKNSYLFLIFFILLISKPFLYGLIAPQKEIILDNIYIKKLEKELQDLKVINKVFTKTKGIYGKVLYQNPYKFNDEVIVAIQSDSVEVGNYVINEKGLVGIVKNVYQNFIVVRLLTSKEVLMQVKVSDCYGLLKYNEKIILTNISNNCLVNINDQVYTSDLGKQDEVIFIGNVSNSGIKGEYEVNLSVNFNNLNYVVVISGEDL